MEDFHEDLIFRFSLGLPSLIRRFIAFRSGQPVTAISNNYFLQAFVSLFYWFSTFVYKCSVVPTFFSNINFEICFKAESILY